jgi:predicted ABC-type ATPase
MTAPKVVVIAGPNGAGKSTVCEEVAYRWIGVRHYVNADVIARGLSAFGFDDVALDAGKVMLNRVRQLAEERADFGFETTLASRSFAPWLAELVQSGYAFHLVYLWLPTEDAAIERVAGRVRKGGHGIPEETIRRRYHAGLKNFFHLYQPLATTWQMYDNSKRWSPRSLIAVGAQQQVVYLNQPEVWDRLVREYSR